MCLLTTHNGLPQEAANLLKNGKFYMTERVIANLPYPYLLLYTPIPGHCQRYNTD